MAGFSEQLQGVESQLAKLSALLEEQAANKRRRRLLTIRFLLGLTVFAALLCTWFAGVYRESRRQAHAVDRLIRQGAFVHYAPRESLLVSMLPGEVEAPPKTLEKALGTDFFRSVHNVSTGRRGAFVNDKADLLDAVERLSGLEYLRLTNLNWKTSELEPLGRLNKLQSLDLSHTALDAGPMPWLRRAKLRWVDLSHTRLSDLALYDLSFCDTLQHLNLERTAISDEGLPYLSGLQQLRYLNLKRSPVTLAAVTKLADALPHCLIEWEPLVFRQNGTVDHMAVRRGYQRFGHAMPPDPRESHRAQPPLDSAPSANQSSGYYIIPGQTRSGPTRVLRSF